MKTGPRLAAIKVLARWEESGLPIDQVMGEMEAHLRLADPRDRDLAFALIYGSLRWRGYLDWVLAGLSREPLARLRPLVMQALRIGLFQMLFMDRIPDSAAVNETVAALRSMRQPGWLLGFVNAILRAAGRRKASLATPNASVAGMPRAARLSHPDWLVARWLARYGEDKTEAICRVNNLAPPLCLRVNTMITTKADYLGLLRLAGIGAEPGPFGPEAIVLPDYRGQVAELPGYLEGMFQVQDEAAQLASLLLGHLHPTGSYLDGCAGLGGKTVHLAQMLAMAAGGPGERSGRIVAVEPNAARLQKLSENLQRLAISANVEVKAGALQALAPDLAGTFSGVLIDAPCSGLGVIRRQPDIRWRRNEEDLPRYQRMQLELLQAAATLLGPAGVLVYATCSMEPEENDEVVGRFLADHPDFALTNCRNHLPPAAAPLVDDQGFFRTIPTADGIGGFFAARLMKLSRAACR